MKATMGWLKRRGGRFYACWNHGGKRYTVATGKTTRRAAEEKLAELVAPYALGAAAETARALAARADTLQAAADAAGDALSLRAAWSAFLKSQTRPDSGPATLARYELQWAAFVAWMAEHRPAAVALRDVRSEDAADYVASLRDSGLCGGTVNKHVALCRLVFRELREAARLAVNPFDGIRRLVHVSRGRRELTIGELRRVCGAATGELRVMLALGMYTGLRLGDVATLRWGEVDTVRGIIARVPHKTERRTGKPVLIPIHAELAAVLAEIPKPRGEYVLPEAAADYAADGVRIVRRVQAHFAACGVVTTAPGTGYKVEASEDGKPVRVSTGKRAVVEVGFHSLRHSFVSLCRAAGAPLSVVEAIVGHASPAMTRHYTHTGADAAAAAIAALPSLSNKPALSAAAPVDWRAEVRRIAAGLNAKSWKTTAAKLVALAGQ